MIIKLLLSRTASVLSWVVGTLLFFFHGSLLQYLGGLALCALGYVLWLPPSEKTRVWLPSETHPDVWREVERHGPL
jgi:hypothetical protein